MNIVRINVGRLLVFGWALLIIYFTVRYATNLNKSVVVDHPWGLLQGLLYLFAVICAVRSGFLMTISKVTTPWSAGYVMQTFLLYFFIWLFDGIHVPGFLSHRVDLDLFHRLDVTVLLVPSFITLIILGIEAVIMWMNTQMKAK